MPKKIPIEKKVTKKKEIDWPALRPVPPTEDLSLSPILDGQIYIIRNLLSSSLCKTYISFLSSLPLVTTPNKPKKDEALRVNDRFQVDDALFAERLWSDTALKQLVSDASVDWDGDVVGLNPNIRVYRYTKGQFFGQHYDESVVTVKGKTTWTLLVYLSRCSGGETAFYPEGEKGKRQPEPIVVGMEVGMALLHRHGDGCLLHEGREVTGGEKWVVRSDLVVKR
ncbi:uncharacterized protein GIQ15_00502 [Arthroderma uncinatum]|uniref:uncharacterized protein n=1 Tax=Arthroderma uncinatum TaxID=74035 RepID=UPI00144ADE81|nr:uncharacterized protein GIQ15_00502 [Arthroderma uncinatum]KAF3490985.1 hypothetical protein GIQ15_00502 [Arthroderma uncinatum]